MKKLFFVMAAVAALLTSCSKDDTFGGPTRGKVTFEVSTPELATRYGEGTTATALQYAVYDMIEDATNGKLVDTGTATLSNKTASVSIDLVEGRKYTAIFWADAGDDSPYTFTPATKTVSYTDVNDLTANNENYDAFFAYVPKEDIKVGQTVNVTLKRPFAQLRIETSDTVRARQLGVEVVKTGITVNAYTSFNLATGDVDGQQNITFKPTTKASASTTVGEVTYDLISMNYILANTRETVDVTLNFTDDVNGTEESYVRKYSSVSVERNHRTLVRGTILTDPTQFDVEVKPGFDSDISEDRNTSETLVVSTADDIREAFENLNDGDDTNDPTTIVLGDDIDLSSGDWTSIFGYDNSASLSTMTRAGEEQDPSITIKKNQELTLDLNGFTLSAISKQTDKNGDGKTDANDNVNLINVFGTLTVQNGTITTKHEGANMEWNASTNVFNVTDGGVLNLSNVIAKNLGGSDMAFVAHLNNWGEVTLNVENSTLESNYVAVRVFNSGYDMNNVTIKNSTLKGGSYAFWVHNYTVADFGTQDKADAQKALLNFDIFNGTNTFTGKNDTPIRYGMTNSIYVDANGSVGVDADKKNYYIYDADGLVWVEAQTDGFFAGKTVKLMSDIDMTDVTIANPIRFWNPENRTTFDGQNHTISNLTMSTTSTAKNPFSLFTGTADIKNIKFDNANISGYSYVAVVAGNLYGNIENCHVSNSSVKCTYWMAGALSGQYNSGNVTNCSVTNTTVTGPAAVGALVGVVNETGGERKLENCTVTDCKVIQEGSFGSDYDKMFGAAVGLINIEESTVRFNGTVTNTTVKGEASSNDNIFGDLGSNNNVYINNKLYVPKSESQKALEAAIAAAADGETVTLTEDVVATQTIVIPEGKNITLDLNGKTITGTMHKSIGHVIENNGSLVIKNGTIKSSANNGGSAVMNNGTITIESAILNGAPNADGSWPSYTINNTGAMTISGSKITSHHGAVASYNEGAIVTLNNSEIDMAGIPGFTNHGIYTYNNGTVVVNGGTYVNNATDQNSTGGSVINGAVEVNAGTFSGRIENYYGTPVLKGGTYSVKPKETFIAAGYKAVENGDGTYSVEAE